MDIQTKPKNNLKGVRKGTLVVLHQTDDFFEASTHKRSVRWLAQCDCGAKKVLQTCDITAGRRGAVCQECAPKGRVKKPYLKTLSPMSFFNAPPRS